MSVLGDLGDPRVLDADVRRRLAQSLAHIFSQAEGPLDLDKARCEAALECIRSSRQNPGVFSRYYDLIFAIRANQLAAARELMSELLEIVAQPAPFAIVPYAPESLGSDYDRFPRLIFAEYSKINPMAPLSDEQRSDSREMLRSAMEIVSRVDPGIGREIDALLVRIYMAVGSKAPGAKHFGGVTSFLVWGASFINVEFYRTTWDVVQFLVHEITHGLLFGLSADRPLVLNPPAESYKSPLRSDPRPMDGLYHAVLVCARVAEFNEAWLESGLIPMSERRRSEVLVEDSIAKFRDGLGTINKHGKLSAQARDFIERSCDRLSVRA